MQTGPGYYIYLISSLPMLHFGLRPPFSFGKFLSMCEGLIPENEIGFLSRLDLSGEIGPEARRQPMLKKWHKFDTALRNEIVRIRAGRRRLDPSKYLKGDGYTEAHLYQMALQAYRNPSPLEGERTLDQERWRYLDEISLGHYFDFDILIIYGLRLLMLEKWEKVLSADSAALVEEALKR